MLKSIIALPLILLTTASFAQVNNNPSEINTVTTLDEQLPKNQLSITGYELMSGYSEFESLGFNYERFIDRKNRFSVGAGLRWGGSMYNNKKESDYRTTVKSFQVKGYYNPLVNKRFEYSVGLGFIYDRYQQKNIGNGWYRNYKSKIGDEISLVNLHRFKWNINETLFFGAESGFGFTGDITGHRGPFKGNNEKIIALSLQLGIKF